MLHQEIIAGAVAKLTPDQIADAILALAAELSASKQVDIIRALNGNLTFSYGSDRIDAGCDMVMEDLRVEEQQSTNPWYMPELPIVAVQPVALNPEAWRA